MTYLLDTHYMLWAISDTKKISRRVKDIMTNRDNRIVVSAISFWEVSLKSSLNKLSIEGFSPEDLPEACVAMGFEVEGIGADDCSTYHQLQATYHKDPFDRMLIWMAIRKEYIMVSADATVKKYKSEGLRVLAG